VLGIEQSALGALLEQWRCPALVIRGYRRERVSYPPSIGRLEVVLWVLRSSPVLAKTVAMAINLKEGKPFLVMVD
jgi:hypothetical protein